MISLGQKDVFLTGFSHKYLVVLTGILGPSKGMRQRANHGGNARAVFNCSGVGFSCDCSSSGGRPRLRFSRFSVLEKHNFSGFLVKYRNLLFTSLFSSPPEKHLFWRDLSQIFFLCIDDKLNDRFWPSYTKKEVFLAE